MNVVFDANVAAAGVGWQGEGWLCLVKLARRQAIVYGTDITLQETRETCLRIMREKKPKHAAAERLTWYLGVVRLVDPVPLGQPRSRDVKDDPCLAAALAGQAQMIVTYDQDLLILGKPFGIAIVRPLQFLKALQYGDA